VKVAVMPQIEGLTVESLEAFAVVKPAIMKYLPNQRDWNHIDKKWLSDVLYTKE
jgi:hypothetical protein